MEITTGVFEDSGKVGLRIQESEYDFDPVTYLMEPELARKVAFALMEEADRLDPPDWIGV